MRRRRRYSRRPPLALDPDVVRERARLIGELMALPYMTPRQGGVVGLCSTATVRRACLTGQLEHHRLNGGRLIRFTPAALRAWLEGQSGQQREALRQAG
jgi:Helix-turn-helix domain